MLLLDWIGPGVIVTPGANGCLLPGLGGLSPMLPVRPGPTKAGEARTS